MVWGKTANGAEPSPDTYGVVVTGTANGIIHNAKVTVAVQQGGRDAWPFRQALGVDAVVRPMR
jgi:cytochrome c5